MTINETQDYELMKSQLEAMKAKLDENKLVSERMIESIIKEKVRFLNSIDITAIIILCVAIPLFAVIFPLAGYSWGFISFAILICAGSVIYTIFDRMMSNNYQRNGSLEEYAITIAKVRKRFVVSTVVAILIVLVFYAFYFYEEINVLEVRPEKLFVSFLTAIMVMIFGVWLTIKQWRALKDIQNNIDKLKGE